MPHQRTSVPKGWCVGGNARPADCREPSGESWPEPSSLLLLPAAAADNPGSELAAVERSELNRRGSITQASDADRARIDDAARDQGVDAQIGRASCRESVCQYG